jgi:photosystem II stability/assembly factor-like uncharacterized protein
MYKRNNLFLIISFLFTFFQATAQRHYTIRPLETPPIKSIRGMFAVSDSVIWVSGTQGKAGISTDAGQHWIWITVPGYDTCDWRTLYAFSSKRALLLNAGEPASIAMTINGGETWESVYFNDTRGIFFDGMTFRNNREGIAIGDPINGRFTLIQTKDGGKTWQTAQQQPIALEGEAIFAASNSSILAIEDKAAFVTGGTHSRFITGWNTWQATNWDMIQGQSGTGAFSVAFYDHLNGVSVGGNYMNDTISTNNCFITNDGGKHWKAAVTPPHGYRSCVKYISKKLLIASGTSGTDISEDGGIHWKKISDTGYHVIVVSPNGKHTWLAGKERIAELVN